MSIADTQSSETAYPSQAALLPVLYQAEGQSWWSRGMRAISHALLDGLPLPAGPILELGCGGGAFIAEVAERSPKRLALGLDLHPVALATVAGKTQAFGNLQAIGANVHRLPLRDDSCALVVGLDVLDQAEVDLPAALAEAQRILKPGGWLLLRVSAYDWLASPHDQDFGTGRRYSSNDLRQILLDGSGWRIRRLTYANTVLLPLVAVARLAERRGWLTTGAGLETHVILGRKLQGVLEAEARWLHRRSLPAGVSLYALAQKIALEGSALGTGDAPFTAGAPAGRRSMKN